LKFQIHFAALAALCLITACPSSKTAQTPKRVPVKMAKIIDAHIHTHFRGKPHPDSEILDNKETLLKEMAASGVVGAVAHTGEAQVDYVDLKSNGIIHCAGTDGRKGDLAKVEKGIKDGKFYCIKIYLGYVHKWANDKSYLPFYKLAQKYDIPVVFHTGDTYGINGKVKYADPLQIDELAVDYRKTIFVIAHCGNPWIQSAAEVAYKNPNVYLDGSAFMIGKLDRVSAEDLEMYVIHPLRWIFGYVEDPKKLLFATDWSLTGMNDTIWAFQQAIPKENWEDVFYNNAKRVFKKGFIKAGI